MPFTATILTPSESKDTFGGTKLNYEESGSAACRLNFVGNNPRYQDAVKAAGISAGEAYLVALPLAAELPEAAHLLINSIEYAVVTQLDARSYATQMRVLVQRVSAPDELTELEETAFPPEFDEL